MRGTVDHSSRGQTLVIVAVGMVVLVGMVGVVIDIGLQWGANRGSQNGSDATAEAGAIVLMEHLLGTTKMDADVLDAVEQAAETNEIAIELAEYTDVAGNSLSVEVGDGGNIPEDAQGIRVVGSRTLETFFARVIGVPELSVMTDATAVTGPAEPCPADGPCAMLPITVPTTVVTCDGQNKSVATDDPWIPVKDGGDEYIIPLCGNNPGSVGWIDWSPTGGGAEELAGQLCEPDPPSLILPDWFWVTSAGNENSMPVDECFAKWIGSVIMIPLFQDTCRTDPGDTDECTDPAPIGGVNQWYYFPHAAAINLTGVYVNGNHADECDTGNGATSCFTGSFVDASITGEVGVFDPDADPLSQFFAVQLID